MNERTEPAGSFEEALERLEDSVDRLESGNLSLADALDVFEEGIAASRTCTRWLDQTRKRVEVLLARLALPRLQNKINIKKYHQHLDWNGG